MTDIKKIKENLYKTAQIVVITDLIIEIKELKNAKQIKSHIREKINKLIGELNE